MVMDMSNPVPARNGTVELVAGLHCNRGAVGRRIAVTLFAAAMLAVYLIVAGPTMITAADSLANAKPLWLLVGLTATCCSMVAFAALRGHTLAVGGAHIPLRRAVAVSYGAGALHTTLPAGAVFSTTYAFRQLRSAGASVSAATWSMSVTGLLSTLTLSPGGIVGSRPGPGHRRIRDHGNPGAPAGSVGALRPSADLASAGRGDPVGPSGADPEQPLASPPRADGSRAAVRDRGRPALHPSDAPRLERRHDSGSVELGLGSGLPGRLLRRRRRPREFPCPADHLRGRNGRRQPAPAARRARCGRDRDDRRPDGGRRGCISGIGGGSALPAAVHRQRPDHRMAGGRGAAVAPCIRRRAGPGPREPTT